MQAQGASAGTAIALSAFAAAGAGGNANGGGTDSPRASWPGPGRRSSQYKGVSWSEASVKWRAQCWNGSKVRQHVLVQACQAATWGTADLSGNS